MNRLAILGVLLVLPGCYRVTVINGRPLSGNPPPMEETSHGAVMGDLVRDRPHRLDSICPDGWAEIESHVSPINWFINSWVPFYSTQTFTVRCAVRGSVATGPTKAPPSDAAVSTVGASDPADTTDDEWLTTKGPGWSYSVPSSWHSETIKGRKTFHPAGHLGTQVFLSISTHEGPLDEYPKASCPACSVKDTEVNGRKGLLLVKVDMLNGYKMRWSSVVILQDNTAYELVCADTALSETSETCKRILRSLRIAAP